jgi:uncharacterized protein (TIGR02996 family)
MASDTLLALLRHIRHDPESNVPRLVLADWLDEHGEPARGEFVRWQCTEPNHPPVEELQRGRCWPCARN